MDYSAINAVPITSGDVFFLLATTNVSKIRQRQRQSKRNANCLAVYSSNGELFILHAVTSIAQFESVHNMCNQFNAVQPHTLFSRYRSGFAMYSFFSSFFFFFFVRLFCVFNLDRIDLAAVAAAAVVWQTLTHYTYHYRYYSIDCIDSLHRFYAYHGQCFN